MIKITETKSIKTIGDTSLLVDFNYNPEIINIIKSTNNAIWHNKLKIWELPANMLAFLVDNLTFIDDIEINLLPKEEEVKKYDLTIEYKTKPFEYQLEGIRWLLNNNDCLLLDPPGLGKTLQTIYTAEELHKQENYEHCLIICGINSLKTNWEDEIKKHSTLDSVVIGKKINSKGRPVYSTIEDRAEQLYNEIKEFFVIINVEMLTNSIMVDAIRDSKNKFDLILFDEVHKAKNPDSKRGDNLLKLKTIGKRHIGMTGTLLVNNPLDAYVPLQFIGKERSTFTNFKKFFCTLGDNYSAYRVTGYKNLDILSEEIHSCSLRRSKSLLNLPPKVVIPEVIEMNSKQSKLYENMMNHNFEEIDRVEIKDTTLLGLVTRMRQAATCPSVLTTEDIYSEKLSRAKDLVDEITSQGEKVVIFSTFKEPLNILYKELKDYNPLLATGDIDDGTVNRNKDLFQEDPQYKVILCTTSKMGTGFTLTAASYEIFLDSTWTAALEEQCEDRCWRIGSNKSVFIYKLIAQGTIDERIQEILENKKKLAKDLIDNGDKDLLYRPTDMMEALEHVDSKSIAREEYKIMLK